MPEIVVAGHLCLDIIPAMASATEIKPGTLIEVGQAHLSTGGCVSNVGIALHKLGIDVRLIGKIGDDAFGGIIRQVVDTHAPGRSAGLVVGHDPSSYTVVISPPGQDRLFLHAPACNDTFSSADVEPSAIAGSKVFHFGYPPLMARMFEDEGAELERLLIKAKDAGALVSLDLSLPDPASPAGRAPWPRILERVLPLVDLFLPSQEELSMMLGRDKSAEELAIECVSMGAGVVVVKRGVDGLVARSGNASCLATLVPDPESWANLSLSQPCFPANVVGTTGAGDATIAGFLLGFVRGFSLQECLRAGCAVGACSVEAPDAISGIRSWEKTSTRFEGLHVLHERET